MMKKTRRRSQGDFAGDQPGLPVYSSRARSGKSTRWRYAVRLLLLCCAGLLLRWRASAGAGVTHSASTPLAELPASPPPAVAPRFTRSKARGNALDEPFCDWFKAAAEGGTEEGGGTAPARETCFEPLQPSEQSTGTGMCKCVARLLWVDYALLNEARAAGEAADELTCARLCRKAWEAEHCGAWQAQPSVALSRHTLRQPLPGALFSTWQRFEDAFRTAGGLDVVQPHGVRGFGGGPEVDWVARGERMPPDSILKARTQWKAFLTHMQAYPRKLFAGRGIVLTGGGTRYMVPMLVSIRMLRATGCTLPVECWFFDKEMPGPQASAELRSLGVLVRSVDEIRPGASKDVFKYGVRGFGYVMKSAILLFSSFEEVIYLDSDNVALRNPSDLFQTAEYASTGMILWPDYWKPSIAPDLFRIAPEAQPPNGTVESGQLVFDKRKVWRALQLALFLNCQGALYYNLLTNYLGMGDKETFPLAMRMLQMPYHAVGDTLPVGSCGLPGEPRAAGGAATLRSTTMVQYHPSTGGVLLFHSNLNKWTLNVPTRWSVYQRRWQVITPPRWRFQAHQLEDPPLLQVSEQLADLRRDPEKVAWETLMHLRCAGWLEAYLLSLQGARDVERAYDFDAAHAGYASFILDEHMTGRYVHQEK